MNECLRLADLLEPLAAGVSVNAEDAPAQGDSIGVLKTSAVSECRFIPSENKRITKRSERHRVATPVEGNSIIISRMNTPILVGENAYVSESRPELFLPDRLWQTRSIDEERYSTRWIALSLGSPTTRQEIRGLATGTSGSMKNLAKADFLGIRLPVPPLDEQRRIAAILDASEATIRATEVVIEKLRLEREGTRNFLVTHYGSASQQATNAGCIPSKASLVPLSEVCAKGTTITYGVVQPGPEDKNGVFFVRGGDFPEGRILTGQLRTISRNVSNNYSRTLLRGGEVVVSLVGQPGAVAVVPPELSGANVARQAAVIRLSPQVLAEYLRIYIQSSFGRRLLFRDTVGSVQQVINLDMLRRLPVVVPARTEDQKTIIEVDDALGNRLDLECNKLAKLRLQHQGILHDLLTGAERTRP